MKRVNKNNVIRVFAAIMLVFIIASNKSDAKEHKNVVVILVDDMGWTDLGSYGSSFYDSPNIDKLANEGVKFTNGYAMCPVCSPTRASIQTGRYPNRTGITDWIVGLKYTLGESKYDRLLSADNKFDLNLREKTIAEVMKENGYKTYFAGKWHLGQTKEFWPQNQGYDVNIGGCHMGMPKLRPEQNINGFFTPYGIPTLEDGPSGEYLPDRLTDETIDFIESNKEDPFFVFLSYYLVHVPLQSKDSLINIYKEKRKEMGLDDEKEFLTDEPWMDKVWQADKDPYNYKERIIQSEPIYAAMVRSLDINVGRVLDALEKLELDDNTMIVFTSDNGGLSTAQGSVTNNAPLRAGKGWLYEGGIRVPFIIKNPDNPNNGIESEMMVSSIDVFPTVLGYAGIPTNQVNIDGINLLPFLNENAKNSRPLFWHYPHYPGQGGNPGSVIRKGKFKLIDDLETGELELYDLEADIGEKNNLADNLPEVRDELYLMLKGWRQELDVKKMDPNPYWNGIK